MPHRRQEHQAEQLLDTPTAGAALLRTPDRRRSTLPGLSDSTFSRYSTPVVAYAKAETSFGRERGARFAGDS